MLSVLPYNMHKLPDGLYPFADTRLPLDALAMREAPRDLETLLKDAAERNGIDIIRDKPVEVTCEAHGFRSATFLVFWPAGSDRIHILAPRDSVIGKA